ncbi:hypothetical protein H6P81_008900 [Aristolochia fimbriata]|uniref:Uncharacterized protein n=1 Tax=Aristolochia fimbriata TaxID=158543 RepID=A0AAV7EJ91_ARIFI|nr:hypothetical protein H6P81_008900 [Aristolochia fimbriata]
MGDPSMPLRTVYTRLPSPSSSPSILPAGPHQPSPYNMYPSSSSSRQLLSYPSSYSAPVTDYFIGHVVPNSGHHHPNQVGYGGAAGEPNYTCMGAPMAVQGGFVGPTTDGVLRSGASTRGGGGGRAGPTHGRGFGGAAGFAIYLVDISFDRVLRNSLDDIHALTKKLNYRYFGLLPTVHLLGWDSFRSKTMQMGAGVKIMVVALENKLIGDPSVPLAKTFMIAMGLQGRSTLPLLCRSYIGGRSGPITVPLIRLRCRGRKNDMPWSCLGLASGFYIIIPLHLFQLFNSIF